MFFKVVLFLIKSGFVVVVIFIFWIVWNEYFLVLVFFDCDIKIVLILIVNNMFEFNVEWGVIMVIGMFLVILLIIFIFFVSC